MELGSKQCTGAFLGLPASGETLGEGGLCVSGRAYKSRPYIIIHVLTYLHLLNTIVGARFISPSVAQIIRSAR